MKRIFNIYIDESCHLEKDNSKVMCIGYIKIPYENYSVLKNEIKKIKLKHKSPTEIKWNRLSMSRLSLYKDLIDYFFKTEMEFRSVLIKNKNNLNHKRYNRNDENSYYFKTLKILLNHDFNDGNDMFRVYLDVKDHFGKSRINLLKKDLDKFYNESSPYVYFQHIHSNENEFLQITDLFIGAISFKARNKYKQEGSSEAKNLIVEYLEKKSEYLLDDGTEPWEKKFNIYDFQIKQFTDE